MEIKELFNVLDREVISSISNKNYEKITIDMTTTRVNNEQKKSVRDMIYISAIHLYDEMSYSYNIGGYDCKDENSETEYINRMTQIIRNIKEVDLPAEVKILNNGNGIILKGKLDVGVNGVLKIKIKRIDIKGESNKDRYWTSHLINDEIILSDKNYCPLFI